MPTEEQESMDTTSDLDQRVYDWTECFQIFQSSEDLEPHHNVEIKELFSLPEVRDGGELVFYYRDYGSFWMQYSPDLYQDGILVEGYLEVNPVLLNLVVDADYIELESVLEEIEQPKSQIMQSSYLMPIDEIDPEAGTVRGIEVPREYATSKVEATISDSIRCWDTFHNQHTKVDKNWRRANQ